MNNGKSEGLYDVVVLYLNGIKFEWVVGLIGCVVVVIYLKFFIMMYCYVLNVVYCVRNE